MGGGAGWGRGRGVRAPVRCAVAVLILTTVAGCSSADGSSKEGTAGGEADPTTSTTAVSVDGASLAQPGTFDVGRSTVDLADDARGGRTLTTDIWYPIEQGAGTEPSTYQFDDAIPAIDLQVAKADAPLAAGGPFPLVVFSHGSPSIRYQSAFFMELLASHGFVVAAPDHRGDSAVDALGGTLDDPAQVAVNRPADVSFVIDSVLGGDVEEPTGLVDGVDPDRIGIVGHSGGGDTVLAVAGGRGGVDGDDRVDAVLAWTPSTVGVPDASLEAIDVPTMLIGATLDDIAPIDPNVERAWDLVRGRPLYRTDLIKGGHDQFTNVCDFLAAADANPDFPPALRPVVDVPAQDACTPELLPIDEAHDLIARYSMAFLLSEVAGDGGATSWLASSAATADPSATFTVRE